MDFDFDRVAAGIVRAFGDQVGTGFIQEARIELENGNPADAVDFVLLGLLEDANRVALEDLTDTQEFATALKQTSDRKFAERLQGHIDKLTA